jgi:hypothetical protein
MTSKEQFFHFNPRYGSVRYTIYTKFSVKNPKKQVLKKLSFNKNDDREVSLTVGLARVNPKDQYNKSIGRKVSKDVAKEQPFDITRVVFFENKMLVTLMNDNFDLTFKLNRDYDNLHLVDAYVRM